MKLTIVLLAVATPILIHLLPILVLKAFADHKRSWLTTSTSTSIADLKIAPDMVENIVLLPSPSTEGSSKVTIIDALGGYGYPHSDQPGHSQLLKWLHLRTRPDDELDMPSYYKSTCKSYGCDIQYGNASAVVDGLVKEGRKVDSVLITSSLAEALCRLYPFNGVERITDRIEIMSLSYQPQNHSAAHVLDAWSQLKQSVGDLVNVISEGEDEDIPRWIQIRGAVWGVTSGIEQLVLETMHHYVFLPAFCWSFAGNRYYLPECTPDIVEVETMPCSKRLIVWLNNEGWQVDVDEEFKLAGYLPYMSVQHLKASRKRSFWQF